MASLADLPPELLIRVCHSCRTVDIASLATTCRSIRQTATSDDVWRPRCAALWEMHAHPAGHRFVHDLFLDHGVSGTWWTAWTDLFGRYRRFLGWWAMAGSPRGRLLRFTLHVDDGREPVHRFKIVANAVTVVNKLLVPGHLAEHVPDYAIMHTSGGYYLPSLPQYARHPDRDMLVDMLNPQLAYMADRPVFLISATHGAHLCLGDSQHMSLQLDYSLDAHLRDESGPLRRKRFGLPSHGLVSLGGMRLVGSQPYGESSVSDGRPTVPRQQYLSWGLRCDDLQIPHSRPFSGFTRGFAAIFQGPAAPPTPPVPVQLVQQLGADSSHTESVSWTGTSTDERAHYLAIQSPQTTLGDIVWHPTRPELVQMSSLTGMFCASYGPHGHEFSWIKINPVSGVLEAVKLTGDPNVPCGETTWRLDPTSAAIEMDDFVPTTTHEELLRLTDGPEADHLECERAGMVQAFGRISNDEYISPSWTKAQAVFIRNSGDGRKRVDEIRMRWSALGHVSCFRRILPTM